MGTDTIMTLQELKTILTTEPIDTAELDRLFIFVCADDNAVYLAKQYAHRLANAQNKTFNVVDRLDTIADSALSLVMDMSNDLSVVYTDTFDEIHESYDKYNSYVVICKKIDKRLENATKQFVVTVNKLLDWQIKDYMSALCPGISLDYINWLYDVTGADLYHIENELDRFLAFPEKERQSMFEAYVSEGQSDLFTYNIFDLQKNIALNKLGQVKPIMQHFATLDLDPIGLNSLLLTLFKKILYINFKSGATLEQLNVKPAAAHYIQADYCGLSFSRVANAIKFLSATDYKLKSGLLDLSKERMLDYIICNLALM